ncbi:hypothetical protein GCM10010259_53790 [Streptomyces daghestanicus]|uniref:Secreted protein n=1 Tax=Streptomyces daghestanicus TaxID=66885 RepID=A0ABQ3QCI6_9ACTN|nr:hypothetical protein GCM10010240_23280 [Streptomyces griseoviridis]GGU55850.1 hypothetical protein GCM10010259_53790 [Streptomyces daghestanicus]GHI34959.1 hypothetical protein Sdagh_66890 [Streptomyces daghestanicus]
MGHRVTATGGGHPGLTHRPPQSRIEEEENTVRIRYLAAALGTAGAIGTSLLVGAPTASADGSVCNPGCEAAVDFQSYGEVFVVHDYASNGVGTIGQFDIKSGGVWYPYDDVVNAKGYDAAPVTVDYEIAEGTAVRYRACQHNSSKGAFDCGGWHTDTA